MNLNSRFEDFGLWGHNFVGNKHEIWENSPLDCIKQNALAISDIFAVLRIESLLDKLKANNIQLLHIQLQRLINYSRMTKLKEHYILLYTSPTCDCDRQTM